MADVVFTASAIKAGSGAAVRRGTAGVAITQGQALYESAGKLYLADADTETAAEAVGIALNAAAADQPVEYLAQGPMTGNGMTAGVPYFVSPNAGGICPIGDLLAGDYVTYVGTATATTSLLVKINASGTVK